ncbi:MAG: helix-hairpin-helix domain-containing protein [Bacteroidales bacterium]|nr:helix-hairpin-helix domain-containing protein [Bacteroidales bacterium]
MTAKEDSVYRSRRKHHHTQYTREKKPRTDSSFYTHEPPAPRKQPLTVELNSADTLTLQLLHGIGPVFARRIVRYRERLGGFVSGTQLLEVYGVTPELLNHIGPYLRIDTTAIRHINPNTLELKQLARHPYIEYYQARDIVRLRATGSRFHSVDDLRAIPSMADSTLERLLPYLDFGDSIVSK